MSISLCSFEPVNVSIHVSLESLRVSRIKQALLPSQDPISRQFQVDFLYFWNISFQPGILLVNQSVVKFIINCLYNKNEDFTATDE